MPGLTRPVFWIAAFALGAATLAVTLRPALAPATFFDAVRGAAALVGVFSLGATGLVLLALRFGRLMIPAVCAVLLSGASLASATLSPAQLHELGFFDACFTVGLVARAYRIGGRPRRPLKPPPRPWDEPRA